MSRNPMLRLHEQLRLWVVIGAVAFGVSISAILLWQVREVHDDALHAAEMRGQNAALLLARAIEGSIREADFVLRDVMGHVEPNEIRFPDPRPRHYQATRNLLREKTLSLPYIYGMGIADRRCIVSYAAKEKPGFDISGRPYCTALRDDPEREVFTSGVYLGQQNFLQLTRGRKIRDGDGAFAGIALMRLDMSFFERYLLDVDVGPHGFAAIADTDLNLAGRKPAVPTLLGKAVDDPSLRRMLAEDGTTVSYRMHSPIDGRERIYSARKLAGLPLVVVVGIDIDDALADWKGGALWGAALVVLLLTLLGLATRHYVVSLRQADAMAWLSAAVEASGDSIVITDTHGVIEYVNPAFVGNTGYSVEETIGQRPNLLKSGVQANSVYADLWRTILAGRIWHGELTNRRRDGALYTDLVTISPVLDRGGRLQRFVAVQHDITERKRMEDRMATLAQFDPLTGLPNRALFQDRLERAIVESRRDGNNFSLLFVDLDGFKSVNDDYGHDIGDELLTAVALRFGACLREADTLGRIGGDEFTVLLRRTDGPETAARVANKMIGALDTPLDISGHDCRIGASIGIAQFPDDGGSAELLMKHADLAMYEAKRRGRNQCVHAHELI